MTVPPVPLEQAELEHVAGFLNRLPFVSWDRFVGDAVELHVYGWILRPDARADFVVLTFDPIDLGDRHAGIEPGFPGYVTSSARHSAEIVRLLYGDDLDDDGADIHVDCQRVETVFGALVTRKVELG